MLHTGRDSDARIRSCSLRYIIGSRAILKFKSSSMHEIKWEILSLNRKFSYNEPPLRELKLTSRTYDLENLKSNA